MTDSLVTGFTWTLLLEGLLQEVCMRLYEAEVDVDSRMEDEHHSENPSYYTSLHSQAASSDKWSL